MNMEHGIPNPLSQNQGFLFLGVSIIRITWILPLLSNGWIIIVICLYIAINRIPNIDCYRGRGQYPTYNIGVPLFMDFHVSHPFGDVVGFYVCREEGPMAYDEKTTTPA